MGKEEWIKILSEELKSASEEKSTEEKLELVSSRLVEVGAETLALRDSLEDIPVVDLGDTRQLYDRGFITGAATIVVGVVGFFVINALIKKEKVRRDAEVEEELQKIKEIAKALK